MAKGCVLFFDPKKGFGFIVAPDVTTDHIFLHYSAIVAAPGKFRTVEDGEEVEFETEPSKTKKGGLAAVNVRRVGDGRPKQHLGTKGGQPKYTNKLTELCPTCKRPVLASKLDAARAAP